MGAVDRSQLSCAVAGPEPPAASIEAAANPFAMPRVCPDTLGRITKFSKHEPNRGEVQERKRLSIAVLPIFGEPSAAIEPSKNYDAVC
jgi:hypothetical protein